MKYFRKYFAIDRIFFEVSERFDYSQFYTIWDSFRISFDQLLGQWVIFTSIFDQNFKTGDLQWISCIVKTLINKKSSRIPISRTSVNYDVWDWAHCFLSYVENILSFRRWRKEKSKSLRYYIDLLGFGKHHKLNDKHDITHWISIIKLSDVNNTSTHFYDVKSTKALVTSEISYFSNKNQLSDLINLMIVRWWAIIRFSRDRWKIYTRDCSFSIEFKKLILIHLLINSTIKTNSKWASDSTKSKTTKI